MKPIFSMLTLLLCGNWAFAQFAPAPAVQDEKENKPAEGAGPAAAGGGPSALFAALDSDGDGVISKVELKKAIVSLKKLDTDKDGTLSLAECGGAGAAPVANNAQPPWIEQLLAKDANKDGKLSANELTENERQMLQGCDLNGDRAIDRQELLAAANRAPAGNGPGGNGAGGNVGNAGRRGGNEVMGRFFQYDLNRDGQLTTDEVPPQAMGMLRGGDLNGDGAINAAEMQAIMARLGDRAKTFAAGADPNAKAEDGAGAEARARKRPRNE